MPEDKTKTNTPTASAPGGGCTGYCDSPAMPPPGNGSLADLPPRACRVIQELTLLLEISETLQASPELSQTIRPMLPKLARHLGLRHGFITILSADRRVSRIDESYGMPEDAVRSIRYTPGEGLIGRALATGEPAFTENVHDCREFLNRTGILTAIPRSDSRQTAFLSVPILMDTAVIGTINVFRQADPATLPTAIQADVRLLTLIAAQIAQAVRLRQYAIEEVDDLRELNQRLMGELQGAHSPSNIVGNSRAIQQVFFEVRQVAASPTTVLIRGESGTGKELVARAIHEASQRANQPFVAVNCAALPENLIESELFGHEKGAFTGATRDRKGRFEQAHGGTLFLDEIGELPASVQGKLLRVLQEQSLDRVGGEQQIAIDTRIVAATNRNLEEMVAANTFRQDLYYRLNVFPIFLPPLRERKSDILALADFFVEKYAAQCAKTVARISTPAIDLLMSYHWPGNVRELENVIERSVLLCNDGVIHAYHLPASLQTGQSSRTAPEDKPLQAAIDTFERELLVEALKCTRGNMAASARKLGLTERQMGLRVRKYNLDTAAFKSHDAVAKSPPGHA